MKLPGLALIISALLFLYSTSAKDEDGGVVPSEGRDRVTEFFKQLKATTTADEEKKVLTDFATWLDANKYKIEVEKVDSSYRLACPYFPPVTPWTEYRFRDLENLKIIPQLEKE